MFKHGDKLSWTVPKNGSKTINIKKYGYYVRPVEGNANGLVWVHFQGNKNHSKVPFYELEHEDWLNEQ